MSVSRALSWLLTFHLSIFRRMSDEKDRECTVTLEKVGTFRRMKNGILELRRFRTLEFENEIKYEEQAQ